MPDKYKVLYYCDICGDGWSSKRARSSHKVGAHGAVRVGRKPAPEPPLGTDRHYQWCIRNNYIPPTVDKQAHAEYQSDYYYRKQKGVRK